MRGHSGSGSSIEVQLRGDRFEILEIFADRAVAAPWPCPGFGMRIPRWRAATRRSWSARTANASSPRDSRRRAVGQSVSSALSSRAVSYFEVEDRELDIVVQHREEDRQTLDQLKKLPVGFR